MHENVETTFVPREKMEKWKNCYWRQQNIPLLYRYIYYTISLYLCVSVSGGAHECVYVCVCVSTYVLHLKLTKYTSFFEYALKIYKETACAAKKNHKQS